MLVTIKWNARARDSLKMESNVTPLLFYVLCHNARVSSVVWVLLTKCNDMINVGSA